MQQYNSQHCCEHHFKKTFHFFYLFTFFITANRLFSHFSLVADIDIQPQGDNMMIHCCPWIKDIVRIIFSLIFWIEIIECSNVETISDRTRHTMYLCRPFGIFERKHLADFRTNIKISVWFQFRLIGAGIASCSIGKMQCNTINKRVHIPGTNKTTMKGSHKIMNKIIA